MQTLLQNPTVQILLVLAVGAWLYFSPDAVAEVIRVQVFRAKSRLARRLDSAIGREEKDLAEYKQALADGNKGLLELKDAKNDLGIQVKWFDDEIAKATLASENAAKAGDTQAVTDALQRVDDLTADSAPVRKQLTEAVARVKARELRLADLNSVIKTQEGNVAEAKSASASNNGTSIDEAISRLNNNDNHAKAQELLRADQAHAQTMREEADTAMETRRRHEKVDAYATGETQPAPVADRAAALMAKYNTK